MKYDLSIIIKTLNEERNIRKTIEAAVIASGNFSSQIIIADSLSDDLTVQIACNFDVNIYQLAKKEDRSCGVGPQLGYQFAEGEFIYLLDGDMECVPGFIDKAIHILKNNPEIAGVSGQIVEIESHNLEFQNRKKIVDKLLKYGDSGFVNSLDGGGIYRKSAIIDIGYLSNRNLHSYEEKEIGYRLLSKKWKLMKINTIAVLHTGHSCSTIKLLLKRFTTRYTDGIGELLRSSINTTYFFQIIKLLHNNLLVSCYIIAASIFLFLFPISFYLSLIGLGLYFIFGIYCFISKKKIKNSLYTFFSSILWTVGLLRGLFSPQTNPKDIINHTVIKVVDNDN